MYLTIRESLPAPLLPGALRRMNQQPLTLVRPFPPRSVLGLYGEATSVGSER